MAERREAEGRTEGTILADSRGARKRFGFGGAPQSPITSAPKHADQWFIEFTSPAGRNMDVSSQAQNVSPITIQTTTQPVDRYGKREYIPTRVDFPEVTVTFYDTVDGKMMIFAKSIYAEFFKNSSLNVDSGLESAIEDINSGRKFPPSGLTGKATSHKNFSKVTLYHFFGGFDSGNGFIQRIVLVNPIVTSITFSESDYSASALRTITVTLQPENIVMGTPAQNPAVPKWMQEGLEFVLEDLDTTKMSEFEKKIIEDLRLQRYQLENGNVNISNIPSEQTHMAEQVKALQDLSKYYHGVKRIEKDPSATAEQKEALLQDFIQVRKQMPTVAVSPESKANLEKSQTVPMVPKATDITSQKKRAGDLMSSISKPPRAPSIDTDPPTPISSDTLTSDDIKQNVKDELVNAHIEGRPIDMKNVADKDLEPFGGSGREIDGEKVTKKVYKGDNPNGSEDWQKVQERIAKKKNRIKNGPNVTETRSSKQARIENIKRQRNQDNVQ